MLLTLSRLRIWLKQRLPLAVDSILLLTMRAPRVSTIHFVDITEEEFFDSMLATNLKGVFLSMKYEISAMLSGDGGTIVNMSSIVGLVGKTGIAPYIASKQGVIGLTKTAALEYAKRNIRVNAIAPGTTLTEKLEKIAEDENVVERLTNLIPMGRMAALTEVAEAVLWLCSDVSS